MQYYYVMLEKEEEDIVIKGVSILPTPIEEGFCITKKEAKELLPVLSDPTKKVIAAENYQETFAWDVVEVDPLIQSKEKALYRVQEHYNMQMNSIALFEMYNVMLINNELASQGYFITDSNREEKYIDIINSGDETLITLLQEYLEMKDRIDPMWKYYNMVKDFKMNLEDMETVEEIDKAVENICTYIK